MGKIGWGSFALGAVVGILLWTFFARRRATA